LGQAGKQVDLIGPNSLDGSIDYRRRMPVSAIVDDIFRGEIGDYFPAKNATSKLYSADDFYNSVMLGLVDPVSRHSRPLSSSIVLNCNVRSTGSVKCFTAAQHRW
jgi:hypothetical protein